MVRILVGLVMVALLGFIGYHRMSVGTMDSKSAIRIGLDQIKAAQKLEPEQEKLLELQLAVSDYTVNHGKAPDSLAQLVPKYFDELPKDPRTGDVFRYAVVSGVPQFGEQAGVQPIQLASRQAPLAKKGGKAVVSDAVDFINPNAMLLDDFTYDPRDKRDPFQPVDLSPKLPREDDSVSPLERYGLGQLRVAAVLRDANNEMRAIVEDGQGKGYTVGVGTRIGNAGGVVVSIEENSVQVVESHVDFTGELVRNAVEMKISKEVAQKGKKRRR